MTQENYNSTSLTIESLRKKYESERLDAINNLKQCFTHPTITGSQNLTEFVDKQISKIAHIDKKLETLNNTFQYEDDEKSEK